MFRTLISATKYYSASGEELAYQAVSHDEENQGEQELLHRAASSEVGSDRLQGVFRSV